MLWASLKAMPEPTCVAAVASKVVVPAPTLTTRCMGEVVQNVSHARAEMVRSTHTS